MSDLISIIVHPTVSVSPLGSNFGLLNSSWSSIDLFDNGCLIGGQPNCAKACKDQGLVWRDAATLQNCLAYPTVAVLLKNDKLDQSGVEAANQLGISSSEDIIYDITDSINKCANDYCKTLPTNDYERASCKDSQLNPFDFGFNTTQTFVYDGVRLSQSPPRRV